jgi:Domain of unknown function (DUF4124)
MKQRLCRAGIVACGLLAALTAAADVYKWTDPEGNTHYTDRPPPPGGHLLSVSSASRPANAHPVSPAAEATPPAPPSATPLPPPDPATLSRLKSAVAADVASHDQQACQDAETRYRAVIGARHLYRDGDKGERTYLSDAEAEAARIDARRDVEALCGHAP